MPKVKTSGGRKLARYLRDAKKAESRSKVAEVGVFSSSRYPDGSQVAQAAVAHEFGTERLPERPVMRNAIDSSKQQIVAIMKAGIDPTKMVLDERTAAAAGEALAAGMRRGIDEDPPLIDTRKLRDSIDVRVGPAGEE